MVGVVEREARNVKQLLQVSAGEAERPAPPGAVQRLALTDQHNTPRHRRTSRVAWSGRWGPIPRTTAKDSPAPFRPEHRMPHDPVRHPVSMSQSENCLSRQPQIELHHEKAAVAGDPPGPGRPGRTAP